MTNILIVAPNGNVDLSSLGDLSGGHEVTIVCWQANEHDLPGAHIIGVPARTGIGSRVRSRFLRASANNLVLRSLLRLSTFDEGRWFWGAASRLPAAAKAARSARVLVAADRDAVLTAWKWGHTARSEGRPIAAVHGYPAARAAIAEDGAR